MGSRLDGDLVYIPRTGGGGLPELSMIAIPGSDHGGGDVIPSSACDERC